MNQVSRRKSQIELELKTLGVKNAKEWKPPVWSSVSPQPTATRRRGSRATKLPPLESTNATVKKLLQPSSAVSQDNASISSRPRRKPSLVHVNEYPPARE